MHKKWLSAGLCLPCVLVHTLPQVCQEICISMNFKTFRRLLSQWTFSVFEIFLTRADPWCFFKEALMSSSSYILATPIYLRLGGSELPLSGFSTLESTLILLFLCPTVFVSSASNEHRSSPIPAQRSTHDELSLGAAALARVLRGSLVLSVCSTVSQGASWRWTTRSQDLQCLLPMCFPPKFMVVGCDSW